VAKRETLTKAEEVFCRALAEGKASQGEAFRQAFPHSYRWKQKTTHERASVLARTHKIKTRIKELHAAARQVAAVEYGIEVKDWLRQEVRLAFSDIRRLFDDAGNLKPIKELDDDTAAAVESIKVRREHRPSKEFVDEVIEVRLARKTTPLEHMGRYLGVFAKDNAQKGNDAVLALLEFIAGRAKLPVIHDVQVVEKQEQEAAPVLPVGAMVPRG
jgi:phage terminase small subunit